MSIAIPERILNYRISATTPTDELLTLRHIYSEVGGYASTILDREHIALSKKCATRLTKVENQLTSRQSVLSAEEENCSVLPEMKGRKALPVVEIGCGGASIETITSEIASTKMLESEVLSDLTVDELYNLYRSWQQRHRKREAEGREHMTFYFEGKIVKELRLRKPADKGEQLKIDYCAITYRNELDNMAFIFSLPVSSHPTNLIYSEIGRKYTPSELLALIKLYSHYRTVAERELLIEYVDMALDSMSAMETLTDKVAHIAIASELVEIGRKGIITIPGWVSGFLEEGVETARKDESVRESELVSPLLTLQLQNGSPKLESEARRIINRCYRRAKDLDGDIDTLVDDLYMAVTCCDYVSRFSVKKMGRSWNELATCVTASMPDSNSSNAELNARRIIRLLKVANEIEDYAPISSERKAILIEMLKR